jgi:integrase/recombinase XerD
MKVDRNGQAAILSEVELKELFDYASPKYRAVFGICLFTGCRISECLALRAEDIVNGYIVLRKKTTKAKNTREIAINPTLQAYLDGAELPSTGYLFPSKNNPNKPMGSQSADEMLNKYCDMLGIQGASTHSFRRTALTMMCNAGIPLSVIQNISGHASLDMLSRYLGVSPEQKKGAIAVITF